MLIYLQMEPKWSQNRIKSIQTNSTHSDHETSIFQHSGPTVHCEGFSQTSEHVMGESPVHDCIV